MKDAGRKRNLKARKRIPSLELDVKKSEQITTKIIEAKKKGLLDWIA
jgi:hypothetical protein